MAKKSTASLLCRVSTREQHKHMNLERQVAILCKKATEDGYEVPEELIFQEQITGDDGDLELRGSIVELRKAIERGRVDVVYIVDITRISRNPYNIIERIKWFTDKSIPVYIEDVGLWTLFPDTKKENKEATDYIFGHATYGQKELEKMKKRTKKGRDELASGGWYVGHLSDGYITKNIGPKKSIIIDEERADVIRRIFDLYINGKSTDEIANILNNDDIPTTNRYRVQSSFFNYPETYKRKSIEYNRNNLKWQGIQVSQILSNEWYVGKRYYNEIAYDIPKIISAEVWNTVKRIREIRSQQFRSNRKKRIHNYLLTNYFYCGKCGMKMYGHTTGKNNHYYCSSVETGNKCGLRGICKENIEAIISRILKFRALNEVINGETGVMSDFFKMNEDEKNKLKEEIRQKNLDIENKNKRIEELKKRKVYLLSKKADAELKNSRDVEAYEQIIEMDNNEYRKTEEEIILSQIEINALKKRLNLGENLKKIISNIENLEDISTFRQLIEKTVDKVEIFNIDKSITYITITYLNHKKDYIIYSFNLLKNYFIYLNHIDLPHLNIDLSNQNILIDKDYKLFFNDHSIGIAHETDINLYSKVNKREIINIDNDTFGLDYKNRQHSYYEGLFEYKDYLSIRNFILEIRKIPNLLWKYEPSLFIDVNDERRLEQEKKYKDWIKKYNTGLPTCLPYVVKDENYENYEKQRKHLYNRKYKIKKHKSLTTLQKEEQLQEVERQLDLLKVNIKYLTREEAVNRYKKNQ